MPVITEQNSNVQVGYYARVRSNPWDASALPKVDVCTNIGVLALLYAFAVSCNHLEHHVDKSRPCYRLLRGGNRVLSAGPFPLDVKSTIDQFLISAAEFASQGCKVYATARKLEKAQALQHPKIKLLPLDVTDDSAVKVVVDTIIANEGKIDIVVNNAGVGCYGMNVLPS